MIVQLSSASCDIRDVFDVLDPDYMVEYREIYYEFDWWYELDSGIALFIILDDERDVFNVRWNDPTG